MDNNPPPPPSPRPPPAPELLPDQVFVSAAGPWRPDYLPPVLTKTTKVIWKRNDGGSPHPVNVEEYITKTRLGENVRLVVSITDGWRPVDWRLGYHTINLDTDNFIKTYIENAQPFKNGTFTLPKIGGKTKNRNKKNKTKRRKKSKKQKAVKNN